MRQRNGGGCYFDDLEYGLQKKGFGEPSNNRSVYYILLTISHFDLRDFWGFLHFEILMAIRPLSSNHGWFTGNSMGQPLHVA